MIKETNPENEAPEHRLKRLGMRSWRRGTKEMDLILGPFSDAMLPAMGEQELNEYEGLLVETDTDLYQWIMGVMPSPEQHAGIIARIRAHHQFP